MTILEGLEAVRMRPIMMEVKERIYKDKYYSDKINEILLEILKLEKTDYTTEYRQKIKPVKEVVEKLLKDFFFLFNILPHITAESNRILRI